MSIRLGIVIIHYNTPEDLGRCLESLAEHAPTCAHETLVVDNASVCEGLDELQDRFPDVRWIRNTENLGYGRGCNQGMATLAADYHLILNPDIVVLPGALDSLLDFAEDHPRAGLIGPQLLNEDGTIQESCRRFYTMGTLVLRRTILGKIFRNSETVDRHLMRDFDHASVRPVDWVLGGCLLVRREALDRCGPMDERFFLYFEDVDWCYRMWQCGFEVVYLPESRFIHRHRRSSASGAFSRSFWLHLGSLISFYEKWSLVVYAAKKWRRPVEVVLHWLLDMLLLALSLLGAYGLRRILQSFFPEDLLPLSWYGSWLGYASIMVTVAFLLMGRYKVTRLRQGTPPLDHFKQMGLVALLLLAGSYLGREEVVSRAVLIMLLGIYTGLTAWASSVIRRLHHGLEQGYLALERTLLVGPRDELDQWLASSGDQRRLGADVVGYVTAQPAPDSGHQALGAGDVPWLGTPEDLPRLVDRFRVSQVAFWRSPVVDPTLHRIMAGLRRSRIRLRWIMEEAWLITVGARAENFGASTSGVLDPDDGHTLQRLAGRPLELVTGMLLLLVAGPARWFNRRNGSLRQESLEGLMTPGHHEPIMVTVGPDDRSLPLWRQTDLVLALVRGRIGITGHSLRVSGESTDMAQLLKDAASARPGLTGAWAEVGDGRCRRLTTFFMNPGGWAPGAGPGGVTASRFDGKEVKES